MNASTHRRFPIPAGTCCDSSSSDHRVILGGGSVFDVLLVQSLRRIEYLSVPFFQYIPHKVYVHTNGTCLSFLYSYLRQYIPCTAVQIIYLWPGLVALMERHVPFFFVNR